MTVSVSASVRVKPEPLEVSIKVEEGHDQPQQGRAVRIRSLRENGHETIEILSDSEDSDACIIPGCDSTCGTPSDVMLVDIGGSESESESDDYVPGSQDMASDNEVELRPSDTQWLDPDVTSRISDKPRRLNRQLMVDRIEYVTGLPSYWPVPRVKTAYIVDLSDPKYLAYDNDGEPFTIDALIKNKVSQCV